MAALYQGAGLELRDYQVRAVEAIRASIRSGQRRVCLVAPTGSGKTVVAAHLVDLARAKGSSILFVAHRKELVDQTSAKLAEIGVPHGVMMPGHPRNGMSHFPVQIASIQTWVRRFEQPEAALVVIDECHHARAATYQKVLDAYPAAPVIGLTATPWRGDGRGLKDLFDASVLAATPAELTAAGWLVPVVGFSHLAPDLAGVTIRRGDYDEAELEAAVNIRRILGDVVSQWQAHAADLATVVFAVTVRHSKSIVETFRSAGVAAEHLDGTTPKTEREAILARLVSGETKVVSNCQVLLEGWDFPALRCIVTARPTKCLGLWLQMVGRGRRPASGKTEVRLHDHTGCALSFGSPDADRDWSLTADLRPRSASQIKTERVCDACGRIYSRKFFACPSCGAEPGAGTIAVETVEAQLVDLADSSATRAAAAKERFKRSLVETAIARRYAPGWVVHRYLEKFPSDPKPWGLYREVKMAQSRDAWWQRENAGRN